MLEEFNHYVFGIKKIIAQNSVILTAEAPTPSNRMNPWRSFEVEHL